MAGGDPLDELISRDPDAVMSQIQAKRRYLRDRRRQRKIADRQGFVDAQSTLESLKTGGVESIMDDKPVLGTGDLRKAEADAAPQFETIEDFEKYVNEQESEIKKTRELFDAYVEETKNLDPRKDHRTIKQRAEVIKQNAKSLKDAEKWLNDSKATTQAAKSKQEVAEDPTFWQKAMGTVADVAGAPVVKDIIDILSAPQAKLAGIASLAAETVSGGDQFASSGTKLGFGDLASAATDFTGQGKLAERGREFNEKVGSVLGTAEAMAEDTPVLGNVLDFAQGGLAGTLTGGEYRGVRGAYETVMGAAGVDPEQARDLRFQIANEFVTDPLMLADAAGGITKPLGQGYNALKSTRVGRQVIAKFPQALVPEKAWLRLQGFAKKSHALGKGEKFEDMVVAQQAFERDAGYVVEKFKQDVASRQAEYLNKLKGLPTEEADRVRESVPLVVEYTDPTTRANLLVSARERGDAASELLYQMADDYASDAEAIKAIENGTLNMHVKDLADDVNYLGRRFRPEVNDIIAHNPDARELLFNAKMESSSKAFQNGWLSWERGRKLRGMDFKEAEETVRQSLRKAGVPIPDDMPIFSRDVFGDLITRADKSLEKSNLANLYQTFSESFGKLPDGADPMIAAAVRNYKTAVPEGPSAEQTADWFKGEFSTLMKPIDGAENALDILIRAKAPLPKTPEEIARLSMTFVSKKDAKLFSDYARAHYWKHIDTPGKFWSVMDAIKGVYQRAVLGRPSSLAKDFQGTMINGAMSGNTPYLERALKQLGNQKQWKQGGKKSDIVARLRGEGVLRNIVSEVEETRGTFRRVAMQLRTDGAKGRAKVLEKLSPLEEKGVLGGGLELAGAKKAGAKVGKATDYIVEARAYTEELNRLATYMKAVDNGAEHADAVEEVYRIWGKFNEMTRFDRDVMSRTLFFWTWWARSIPITIRHLLDRPVKSRLLLTMMAGNVTSDEDMPPWLRRMGGAMLGRDQSGNAKVLNVAGGTYFQPMTSLLQGEMVKNMRAGNMAQAAVGAGKDMLRSAPPYVSEPLGAAFEQDMFTGRDWWRDKNAKTGSQIRAPMAFRWLLDTEIGNVLGLKENNQDGELRYITMDPYWATLIGMTPGLEPVMADVSSFTDPRQEDVAGGVSLTKGLVRQAGLPLYSVPMDDKAARNVREGQTALKKAIDKNAPALAVNGDYVYANESTTRGAKLKADWERYEAEARAQGHSKGSDQFKAYVASQLQRDYPGEFRYIDIGEKLRFLNQMQKNGEVLPLNGLDLRKSDRVKERITTQDMAEHVRKRTR